MKRYYIISAFIHVVLVMMVIIAGAFNIQKPPEMVTVILNNEAFMAGGSGGDGKIPGSQKMDRIEKGIIKEAPKVKRHPIVQTSGKIEEVDRTTSKEAETNDTIPSNESSEVTMLGNPMQTDAAFDMETSGVGFGGGGTGTGGYGPGSGFGGIGQGGTGGTGKGYGVGQSEEYMKMRYLREHFNYIRDLIMRNLTYPLLARKMRWEGQVTVSFIICEKGTVERIRVIKSSGYKVLDENVKETIKEVQPFPQPPVRAEIIIPVTYKLG